MAQAGSIIGGMIGLIGGFVRAKSERQAAEHNALIKERQSGEERAAAQLVANEKRLERDQLVSTQRALLAAQGQDLGSGQALLITSKAYERGERIARTAEIEGDISRDALLADARFERESGQVRARTAILSGFGSFIGSFG